MRAFAILIVALLMIGCGDSAPTPPPANQNPQLEITAIFTPISSQGSVVEAGLSLDNGNVVTNTCPDQAGCRPLTVVATSITSTGAHNLDFVLVRHNFNFLPTSGSMRYGLTGTVNVRRGGNIVQQITLDPQAVDLAPGSRFQFHITVNP
jgi:hypothetical protein